MLKKQLNDLFLNKGKNPQAQDEVALFRALIEVMNKRHFACFKEFHGNKGHVDHLMQYPVTVGSDMVRRCEIADVLMLFIDDGGNVRYSFLQNKRDKKIKYSPSAPLQRIKADPVQWDLLHNRCYIVDTLETGLPNNCLSSAILNSAGSYGIFVNDLSSETVDMSYNIARDLSPVSSGKISKRRYARAFEVSTAYNRLNFVDGYWEIAGTATLDEFETAAQAMFVGSPLEADNPRHAAFAQAALSYAYTSLINERQHSDFVESHGEYFDYINRSADRLRVELGRQTYLPYNLVVMRAKRKYFAAGSRLFEKYFDDARGAFGGSKMIFDRGEIYGKIGDGRSVVIIDSAIVKGELADRLSAPDSSNCLIAEPCEGGIILTNAYEYINKK